MEINNCTRYFMEIGQFVARLKSILRASANAYPVIGASGNQTFLEIAYGPMETRIILVTIYVDIARELHLEAMDVLPCGREIFVAVPNQAHLIGFLRLLEAGFGNPCQVLHPLDEQGDFFTDWQDALNSFSASQI